MKDKSSDPMFFRDRPRSSEGRRGTDKSTRPASYKADHTSRQANKSSSGSSANKRDQQDYNDKSKKSETRTSSCIHDASGSNSYSKSDSNRKNHFKVVEPSKTGSKLVVKRIPVSEVTVPAAPPKIILKRKEIHISPPITKLPATLESPANVKEVEANRPAEIEDFEMINKSQDLPAVGDETSIESSTSRTPPTPSINATEPQTRREPTGELMEDGVNKEQNQSMSGLVLNEKGK